MIGIRQELCNDCGICLTAVGGYCIECLDGALQIDRAVCNECARCVSICPKQVFVVDGQAPSKATKLRIGEADFLQLIRSRRSVKTYKATPIARDVLAKIADASKYAPSMNKSIAVLVIDEQALIREIDAEAMRFVRRWYRMLFGSRVVTWCLSLFSETLPTIKKKMERDLTVRRQVIKDHTQALILVYGNKRIPVTESSGQYYLAVMSYYAHILGVGTTLMDSLKLALNRGRRIRHRIGLPRRNSVLGVLSLGYPKERFVNIPEGIKIRIDWNQVRQYPASARNDQMA